MSTLLGHLIVPVIGCWEIATHVSVTTNGKQYYFDLCKCIYSQVIFFCHPVFYGAVPHGSKVIVDPVVRCRFMLKHLKISPTRNSVVCHIFMCVSLKGAVAMRERKLCWFCSVSFYLVSSQNVGLLFLLFACWINKNRQQSDIHKGLPIAT